MGFSLPRWVIFSCGLVLLFALLTVACSEDRGQLPTEPGVLEQADDDDNGHGNDDDGCDEDNPGNRSGPECDDEDREDAIRDQIEDCLEGTLSRRELQRILNLLEEVADDWDDDEGDNGHGNDDDGCDEDNPGNSSRRECDDNGDDDHGDDDEDLDRLIQTLLEILAEHPELAECITDILSDILVEEGEASGPGFCADTGQEGDQIGCQGEPTPPYNENGRVDWVDGDGNPAPIRDEDPCGGPGEEECFITVVYMGPTLNGNPPPFCEGVQTDGEGGEHVGACHDLQSNLIGDSDTRDCTEDENGFERCHFVQLCAEGGGETEPAEGDPNDWHVSTDDHEPFNQVEPTLMCTPMVPVGSLAPAGKQPAGGALIKELSPWELVNPFTEDLILTMTTLELESEFGGSGNFSCCGFSTFALADVTEIASEEPVFPGEVEFVINEIDGDNDQSAVRDLDDAGQAQLEIVCDGEAGENQVAVPLGSYTVQANFLENETHAGSSSEPEPFNCSLG